MSKLIRAFSASLLLAAVSTITGCGGGAEGDASSPSEQQDDIVRGQLDRGRDAAVLALDVIERRQEHRDHVPLRDGRTPRRLAVDPTADVAPLQFRYRQCTAVTTEFVQIANHSQPMVGMHAPGGDGPLDDDVTATSDDIVDALDGAAKAKEVKEIGRAHV